MEGILLIDKPVDWTSFDVVNYVRGIAARVQSKKPRNVKVGHTGTLDPLATGLLVVCVGSYTKRVPELLKQDKTYVTELTLGYTSATADAEGELTHISNEQPTREQIDSVLGTFVGEIQQVPPVFSAIKVNGKRAYDLARAGKPVELEPRTVRINSITDVSYDYPKITFTASVGSGTYIRSLARDIGELLHTGAYMSALRRVEVGGFTIDQACAVREVTEENIKKLLLKLDN